MKKLFTPPFYFLLVFYILFSIIGYNFVVDKLEHTIEIEKIANKQNTQKISLIVAHDKVLFSVLVNAEDKYKAARIEQIIKRLLAEQEPVLLRQYIEQTKTILQMIIIINFFIFIIVYLIVTYLIEQIEHRDKINRTIKDILKALDNIGFNDQKTLDMFVMVKNLKEYLIYSKTDLLGIITEVSEGFCKLTGYSREELIGKTHAIIKHPDVPEITYKKMWETISEDKVWVGEVKVLTKFGSTVWFESTILPLFDEEGVKCGYLSLRHDITYKKKFELQQLENKIEED